jgi:hypothetical protein
MIGAKDMGKAIWILGETDKESTKKTLGKELENLLLHILRHINVLIVEKATLVS